MKKILVPFIALALVSCGDKPDPKPDLGVAPAARMPQLNETLRKRAEPLPPITDPSLGGIHRDGVDVDIKYNDLAHRYNFLIDVWNCVSTALEKRDSSSEVDKCMSRAGKGKE